MRQASLISRFSLSSVALLALSLSANAATLFVPSKYPTIQVAIDKASAGDVVEVDDGVYAGPGNFDLDFQGKDIEVISASGDPQRTIIDCLGRGRGFRFVNGETPFARVSGVTVRNGSQFYGAGIYCDGSSPTIDHCIFENNVTDIASQNGYGGAIYLGSGSVSAIKKCVFLSNRSAFGPGIYSNTSGPTIDSCTFTKNVGCHGGALTFYNSVNGIVQDCQFASNAAVPGPGNSGQMGAAIMFWGSSIDVNRCQFVGNSATEAGGIQIIQGSAVKVQNSLFFRNTASGSAGGGIFCRGGSLQAVNCVFVGNKAGTHGGAIALSSGSVEAINCTLVGNESSTKGGGISNAGGAPLTVANCILFDNNAPVDKEIFGVAAVLKASLVDGYPGLTALPNGQGNFSSNPNFVRLPFTLGSRDAGDLHLNSWSPAIDQGLVSALPAGLVTDFDGRARVRFSSVDLGAFEF